MKKNITPLLFGIVFILAGIGYIGNMFLDWNFDLFFNGWWTLFIIVPSFISILANGFKSFNLAAFFIGVVLLLSEQFPRLFYNVNPFTAIISIVIISIGVSLISSFFKKPTNTYNYTYGQNAGYQPPPPPFKENDGSDSTYAYAPPPNKSNNKNWSYDETSCPNYNAILSGVDTKNCSSDFGGASISAILGGVDLDLRDAIVNRDVTVYVTAIMGGVDIYAPQNVKIALSKTDILGGTTCKAYTMPQTSDAPVVNFVCTTVMGGIDIK